jgi:hypothetical protein
MQLNETRYVALNEYGTNLAKSKHYPLVVIEAKSVMAKGKEWEERTTTQTQEN